MTKWKCPECGSTDMDVKAWVKINSLNKSVKRENIETIENGDSEDYWCNGCEQHIKPVEAE